MLDTSNYCSDGRQSQLLPRKAFYVKGCTIERMYDTYAIEELNLQQLADRRHYIGEQDRRATKAMRERVVEYYRDGKSITELAKESNLSRVTIYAWLKEFGLK